MTDLLDILGRVIPRHKAPYVVDLLTWRRNSGRVFDIQYQPIFALDDVATVPMNILASSNIVRNSLQLVRDRIYGSDADDPVSRFVDDALTGAGWKTRTKLKYSFSGVSGEIDVLSLINSVLFVFECKNSLHPCNMYEIRTTWDHLKRAGEQLGRFLGLWVTRGFHEYLSSLVGWSIPADTRVQTAVVSGNRMFTGYRVEGNPVRSVYELTAFIAEGTVRIGNEVKCFWAGETVTPGDLVAYLKDDLVHKPHFDAMEAVRHRYRIGRATIYEEVFVLNVLGVAGRLGFDVAKLAAEDADLAL